MGLRIFLLLSFLGLSISHELHIHNNCPFVLWPGTLGNWGKEHPARGGFKLNPRESRILTVPMEWGGRVWGRTNCDETGKCETGDCGHDIECNGKGGIPPVSLAEITFDGWGGIDYYDVSLVDGYNLQIKMEPVEGTYRKRPGNDYYDCTVAGCTSDLNSICPNELRITNSEGRTIQCMSACMRFNTDEYCCRGAHDTPDKCKSTDWPFDYPAIFKRACPDAYSYAYDDTTSTFTCEGVGPNISSYHVTFCP